MNDLTKEEKIILYNMVFDRYYSIIAQKVSPEIRQEYLMPWEITLNGMKKKMEDMGWNGE